MIDLCGHIRVGIMVRVGIGSIAAVVTGAVVIALEMQLVST